MTAVSTLGERLDLALKRVGITPYRLGKDTGTDAASISRTLSGASERHHHVTLALWAKRLGVRMEWLSTGDGPMNETKGPPRLKDRSEWSEVRRVVLDSHPELVEVDVDEIGEMYDHDRLWPDRLDPVTIAGYAAIQRDGRARAAAFRARPR